MASYILRKIDTELWQAVREKASAHGINIKTLVEQLLRAWLKQ